MEGDGKSELNSRQEVPATDITRASLDRRSPLRDWLLPPVLFPSFLFLLIVGYAIRACADS